MIPRPLRSAADRVKARVAASEEREGRLARWVRIGKEMLAEWSSDRVPDLAASVAFYAILSLLPAVLAFGALLGVLDSIAGAEVASRTQEEVVGFLQSILTSEAEGTLDATTELFTEERPGLLTFSLLAAFWALSRGFAALVRALDVVYDLDEKRPWIRIRSTALVLAFGSILAAAVLITLFVLGPLLGSGEDIAAELGLGEMFTFVWNVVRPPLAFVVLVLWAATVFHLAPDHKTPWTWELPGAVLTTVLWLLFSGGLRVYIEVAQQGNAIFGALGGVLIVLLWFWLLSLAVMIGGELNQVMIAERTRPVMLSDLFQGAAQSGDEVPGVDGGATVEEEPHDGRGDDHPVGDR